MSERDRRAYVPTATSPRFAERFELSPAWHQALVDYEAHCLAKGSSFTSTRQYSYRLAAVARALDVEPWPVTVAQLQTVLDRSDWSANYRRDLEAVVRGFYAWAASAGIDTGLDSPFRMPRAHRPARFPAAWEPIVAEYLEDCRARGLSTSTLRWYRHRLQLLARELPVPLPVSAAELRVAIAQGPWDDLTRRRVEFNARAFYRWARSRGRTSVAGQVDPRRREPVFPAAWQQPIVDYRAYAVTAGMAPSTIRMRLYRLARVAAANRDPWAVTGDDLVAFMAQPAWSAETRSSVRSALRTFYGWALDSGRVDHDPSRRLPTVRVPGGKPRPAPDSVLVDALGRADDRERLMLLLGAHAGLRAHEIAKVHSRDVVDGVLRVVGKGGKTRTVPVGDQLARELAVRDVGYVFPGQIDGHISAGRVTVLVSRLLDGQWTAHTLRHAFASHAYAADRDILAVQQLLGHSSPTTTARYAALPDDALRRAVSSAAAGHVVAADPLPVP